jgi:hypothetical protein
MATFPLPASSVVPVALSRVDAGVLGERERGRLQSAKWSNPHPIYPEEQHGL